MFQFFICNTVHVAWVSPRKLAEWSQKGVYCVWLNKKSFIKELIRVFMIFYM